MTSSDEEDDILFVLTVASLLSVEAGKKSRCQRRWWVRPALQQRDTMSMLTFCCRSFGLAMWNTAETI
ncbi:hypothetical protein MRX96_012107 [Rhipicephalus microplus]